MKRGFIKFASVCLALLPALAWAEFSFRTLGAPAEGISYASAVSADGKTVVGTGYSFAELRRPFIWTEQGGFVLLPHLYEGTGFGTIARAVSNNAVVTGFGRPAPNQGGSKAFRWSAADGMECIDGTDWSSGYGIDAAGETIIGYGAFGWRWTRTAGVQNLGDLPGGYPHNEPKAISPNGQIITGISSSEMGNEAFSWTEASGMIGLGMPEFPNDASADGTTLVGSYAYNHRYSHAYRWTQQRGVEDLGVLPNSTWSQATDVSADGAIIIGFGHDDAYEFERFFIWSPWTGMMEFEPFLRSKDTPGMNGWEIVDVQDISADGRTIVGEAYHYAENRLEAFIATIDRPGPRLMARPVFRGGGGE